MATSILETSARDVLVSRYTIVATVCFVTHEYLINLDHEVRYLWQRRFTFGSVLLFLCRYLPIAQIYVSIVEYVLSSDLSQSNCKTLLKANSGLVFLQFCLSNMVLYTRAYAVWAGNKRILAALATTYILSAFGTAYTVFRYVRGISVLGIHLWNGCIYLVTDHSIFYALIGSALMDSLALCLLLYKSVQHARVVENLGIRHGSTAKVSLLTVMAQDGLAYFVFNIICTVANTIVLQRASDDYRDFLVTTQSCVQNVLCARLFFHIQTANKTWGSTTTMTGSTLMEMKVVRGGGGGGGSLAKGHRKGRSDDKFFDNDATWTGLTYTQFEKEDLETL